MLGFAARDRAADLAVARETAEWWHAAAQREHDRAEREAEARQLAEDRLWRLTEALMRSAQAKAAATPPSGPVEAATPSEAPAEQAPPQVPPDAVLAAIRRMAGSDARLAAHLTRWVQEPEQVARWREPRSVPGLIDEICRGKR